MANVKWTGVVSAKRGRKGLPGVKLRLLTRTATDVRTGPEIVTRPDGSFRIELDHDSYRRLAQGGAEFVLAMVGADGQVLREDAIDAAGGSLDLEIERPEIGVHLLPSWQRKRGPLLTADRVDTMRQAKTYLPADPAAPMSAPLDWPCPLPWLVEFPDLLDMAWDVLDGDPVAIDRFRDVLATLAPREGNKGWLGSVRRPDDRPRRPVKERDALIPHERLVPMFLAATAIAGGDATLAERYAGILIQQLQPVFKLEPLWRASRHMQSSNTPAKMSAMSAPGGGLPGGGWGPPGLPCGPDDGPMPFPPKDPDWPDPILDPGLVDLIGCASEMVGFIRHLRTYRIDSITPDTGCAGTAVVIKGIGFGDDPGEVRFGSASATPTSWADDEISVTVPTGATCGPVFIQLPPEGLVICDRYIPIRGTATATVPFKGGLPKISEFRATGLDADGLVTPGSTVTLHWSACPDGATVDLHVYGLPGGDLNLTGLPTTGSHAVSLTGITQTTNVTASLIVTSACGTTQSQLAFTVHRRATVRLTGMEITQATQFYRADEHITVVAAQGADNSVPMVARKPTLVRVYFACDQDLSFNNGQVSGVRISLRGTLDGTTVGPINPTVTPLVAQTDDSVPAQRGNLARSANFLLPWNWRQAGHVLSLEATLTLDGAFDQVDAQADVRTLGGITFQNARPLDVCIVRVNYTGTNGPIDAPTLADCISTLSTARRMYPTHDVNIWLPSQDDQVIGFGGDLTALMADFGGCGPAWDDLLGELQDIAKGYDNDDDIVWCGVLGGLPVGTAIAGCGTGTSDYAQGFAIFAEGDGLAAAHEVGHALGQPHTFADGSNYPNYGYAKSESIGEYGVDVERFQADGGGLAEPTDYEDVMSYGWPKWISPHTYRAVMNTYFMRSNQPSMVVEGGAGPRPKARMEQMMVCGVIDLEKDEVKLHPLYHVPRFPKARRGEPTDYEVALLDAEGRTLIVRTVLACPHCMKYGRRKLSEALPFHRDAHRLEVRKRGKVLIAVDRPEGEPRVSDVILKRTRQGPWRLAWRGDHSDGRHLIYGVAVTFDGGARWRRVPGVSRATGLTIDPDTLEGGDDARFRIYATDGFNTSWADSEPFSMPRKPPIVVPLNFEDGAVLTKGMPAVLEVEVIDRWTGSLRGDAIKWKDKRGKTLGTGRTLVVDRPTKAFDLQIEVQPGERMKPIRKKYRLKVDD